MNAREQLESFLAKFTPEVASVAQRALARMRKRLPGAIQLVYDNYNALAIGFGPTEGPSEAVFSIVIYPQWVTLCFLQGAGLPDLGGRLQGSGNVVRHVRLENEWTPDEPEIQNLMREASRRAKVHMDPKQRGQLFIKSISAKQRPRRPRPKAK